MEEKRKLLLEVLILVKKLSPYAKKLSRGKSLRPSEVAALQVRKKDIDDKIPSLAKSFNNAFAAEITQGVNKIGLGQSSGALIILHILEKKITDRLSEIKTKRPEPRPSV